MRVIAAGAAFWRSPPSAGNASAAFQSSVSRLPPDVRERVVGSSWRPGLPGSDSQAPARPRLDPQVRRLEAAGAADHPPDAGAQDRPGDAQAVARRLSDPAHAPHRRLRRGRRPLDEGRQHLGLQLPLRRRHQRLVDARLREGDRPEPGREPLRLGQPRLAREGREVRRPLLPSGRSSTPATRSSARSRPSAGAGAAPGRGGTKDYQHFSATNGHRRRAARGARCARRPGPASFSSCSASYISQLLRVARRRECLLGVLRARPRVQLPGLEEDRRSAPRAGGS